MIMNISKVMPTASPTDITSTVINPCIGGVQNSKTYWVGGGNIFPITGSKSILSWRHNDFLSTSTITKNCKEGLLYKKKLFVDKYESKITHTSWIT